MIIANFLNRLCLSLSFNKIWNTVYTKKEWDKEALKGVSRIPFEFQEREEEYIEECYIGKLDERRLEVWYCT